MGSRWIAELGHQRRIEGTGGMSGPPPIAAGSGGPVTTIFGDGLCPTRSHASRGSWRRLHPRKQTCWPMAGRPRWHICRRSITTR
jgi:hypothetical protein